MLKTYLKFFIYIIFLQSTILFAAYPEKPVKWVFPNKAGSGYHKIALALAQELKKTGLAKTAIAVQAMPGGGTSQGTRFVQEQAADGYTLMFIHEAPLQTSKLGMLGFNIMEEFEILGRYTCGYPGAWARADADFNNMAELKEYSKSNPVRLAINTGALSHLEMITLADRVGFDPRLVHVSGGGAGFKAALLAGDIDVIHGSPHNFAPLVKAGKVKGLATYGKERSTMAPDVPTFIEQGYQLEGTIGNCSYLWVRTSAPQEVKDYWRSTMKTLLSKPEVVKRLTKLLGKDIEYFGGPDLTDAMNKQYVMRANFIDKFNVKVN